MGRNEAKAVTSRMNVMMGVLMSLVLSFVGTYTSGHFSIESFITCSIISMVISIMLGFVIPIRKICKDMCKKMNLKDDSLPARIVNALISDMLYTPLITFIMVGFSISRIVKASNGQAQIPFIPVFLRSLLICFCVGYVVIFIFQPLLLKYLLRKMNHDQ